jgi:hypothetical protein
MQRVEASIAVLKNSDMLQLKFEGCKGGDWIQLQDPVAGSCERGNESLGSIKGGEILD